jgi:rhodanese-related sulfurtransferase
MDQTVEALHEQATPLIPLGGDVSQEEMWKISQNKSALIVDARPNVFYQLSHIPGAVSLPRDDFEAQYKLLGEKLEPYKIKLVIVYCAELDCHDSQMVGDALTQLGFRYVRLYRLGWSDWEQAGLPQEKSE